MTLPAWRMPSPPRSASTTEGEAAIDVLDRAGALDALLVLDNAEHVLDAAADVVARAVGRGAGLRVLATSRERLGVDGEHVRPVAPLATDTAGAPARRLLVERAAAIAPNLTVEIDDELVAGVVRRLDGLPLAIEMAAAQLSTMSLVELDAELGRSLGTLRTPHRHAPARHQTLSAVLEWSEARLDDDERATLADLAVFAGSFTAEDAVAVLGRPEVGAHAALARRPFVGHDRSDRTGHALCVAPDGSRVRDRAPRRLRPRTRPRRSSRRAVPCDRRAG